MSYMDSLWPAENGTKPSKPNVVPLEPSELRKGRMNNAGLKLYKQFRRSILLKYCVN